MPQWGAGAQYSRLIEQHGGTLLHLAILLTGNRHDAEDIVRDAVLSVALAWPTARPKSGLAYLKRAVTNRSIDVLRARREIPVEAVPEVATEDLGFLRHEEDRQFFAMVDILPLRQRATLVLRTSSPGDSHSGGCFGKFTAGNREKGNGEFGAIGGAAWRFDEMVKKISDEENGEQVSITGFDHAAHTRIDNTIDEYFLVSGPNYLSVTMNGGADQPAVP